MEVLDFEGTTQVGHDDELLERLRRRRDDFGAFVLSHGRESLWVHINRDAAYLWYLPDRSSKHPGFVPDGMWAGEQREFRFMIVGGYEADAISPPWWQLVSIDVAYRAATEFLHSPTLPPSVKWFEL